jgi:hypothetical protein
MTEFVIAYSLQWELGGSMRHLKGGKGGEKEKEKGRKEKEKRGKRTSKARESFRIHLGGAIERGRTSEKRKTDGR